MIRKCKNVLRFQTMLSVRSWCAVVVASLLLVLFIFGLNTSSASPRLNQNLIRERTLKQENVKLVENNQHNVEDVLEKPQEPKQYFQQQVQFEQNVHLPRSQQPLPPSTSRSATKSKIYFDTEAWNNMLKTQLNAVSCMEPIKEDLQTITALPTLLANLQNAPDQRCRDAALLFDVIYSMHMDTSDLLLQPSNFRNKMKSWLGNNSQLLTEAKRQTIVTIRNEWTQEEAILNPFRDKRPVPDTSEADLKYIKDIAFKTKLTCDLCNYTENTAMDSFGRLESLYCYTMANAFKLDSFHSMVVYRDHDPHGWTEDAFKDAFLTAQKWFHKANSHGPAYVYPHLMWDLLPKASASQVHPHIHTTLNKHGYYGLVKVWQEAARNYQLKYGRNYFVDMVSVHSHLGLATKFGSAVAFAHLVPKKDFEVIIISPTANNSFFQLVYFVLRAYIEDLKKFCFSLAIILPPMNETRSDMPAMARVVTRGSVSEIRSDVSSIELFLAPNVNIDPFTVAKKVIDSVQRRADAAVPW